MLRRGVNKLKSKTRLWWAFIVIPLIILAVAGYALFQQAQTRRLNARPDRGATLATADLLATANTLKKSFDARDQPSKVTSDYLGLMNNLQRDCRDIMSYQAAAQSAKAPEATITRLHKSALLCDDLSKMATTSSTIYTAASPLLSASPKLKRYQTLPPFSSLLRRRQTKAVDSSIRQLSQPVKTMEYPTQSVVLLQQLQASMQTSPGLSYYPALQTFQAQLLIERQRYWTDFGDLSGLIRTLGIQLNRYCQSLPSDDAPLPACHQQP